MSNPSKKKGTAWETELLEPLRRLFGPNVERSAESGINDYGDFVNIPFLIEAKSTMRPSFQQWARVCERKAGRAWSIVWKGDRRAKTGSGPYVVMPLELFELVINMALQEHVDPYTLLSADRFDRKMELQGSTTVMAEPIGKPA